MVANHAAFATPPAHGCSHCGSVLAVRLCTPPSRWLRVLHCAPLCRSTTASPLSFPSLFVRQVVRDGIVQWMDLTVPLWTVVASALAGWRVPARCMVTVFSLCLVGVRSLWPGPSLTTRFSVAFVCCHAGLPCWFLASGANRSWESRE